MAPASSLKHDAQISYEDFVHSMTDKPQYFGVVFNNACVIAKNIGINDDDKKEEFALVAIEHLWSKLDRYDPSRAEFVKFFNECIGNKIKDQIRASKSDKVFGKYASGLDDINDGESFPDEGEDKHLKELEYADELVGEFKKFIDALSPEKRMIFCATEFGKLAMGENPSGRSYAEIIAARTGRTAAAIRKMAERLKMEAKGYMKERGFDYGTFSMRMEFLTVKPKEENVDFSTLDWNSLSCLQRLKVRMYLYEKAVEDGVISAE